MSAIPRTFDPQKEQQEKEQTASKPVSPTVFDLTAHYEPSSHFRFSRRVRNEFDELASKYSNNTWLLGRYGGKARMQTDINGIGVASRVEVGRLSLVGSSQLPLIESAFRLFRESQDRDLVSGKIDRILIHFKRCDERSFERDLIRQTFAKVFDGAQCCFLNYERDQLELGQVVTYQSLVNYMREDGPFHHSYRRRIDAVQRHLQQEVGRYENHHFFVRPRLVEGQIPAIDFVYTGAAADRKVEAFVEGYTEEKPIFIDAKTFRAQRSSFVELKDYERASRRFGGVWVLQRDIVRLLMPQQISVLYLFFDSQLQPEVGRVISWDELHERQRLSPYIPAASRRSQTFLEMLLEGLVNTRFIVEEEDGYRLAAGFDLYNHVTFYQLGEYAKRQL